MASLPYTHSLDLELKENWLTVWFNQPEQRNPLTEVRVQEITEVCNSLHNLPSIRGVTFRGRGNYFCSGGDLKGFHQLFDEVDAKEKLIRFSADAALVFDEVERLPQFTIMAIEGGAFAGGFGLACCGDLVIATQDASFALSEIRLGIIPAQITPIIVRRIGQARSRKLMLMADVLGTQDAVQLGFLDEIVSNESEMDERLNVVSKMISKTASQALATTKKLIRDVQELDRAAQIDRAAVDFAEALLSDEGKEGVAAFLNKRSPDWANLR